MKILFLTQIIPYPPDAGPRVKTWNALQYLTGQGYQVTLASFIREEEKKYLPILQDICEAVYAVPIRRSPISNGRYWIQSQVTRRPYLVERDDLRTMRQLVDELCRTKTFDIVHADQLTMAQFALPFRDHPGKPQLIFDAHNAVWTIIERARQTAPILLKPVLALEASRIKRYEGRLIREFDHTLAVTEIDKQALIQARSAPEQREYSVQIHVIPIAVDTKQLQPVDRIPGSKNIMTLGTLRYPPNADGIRWFAQQVFPIIRNEIPDATLTIIGKDPPKDFYRLAAQSPHAITVTGYVPDLTPYLQKAALMAIPVRVGGGMRVRILEAFSQAMPVITTTVGMEGIEARNGEDLFVEDTVMGFASATIRLLQDPALQTKLAVNGRHLAERIYDQRIVLQKLDAIYRDIEQKKTRAGYALV